MVNWRFSPQYALIATTLLFTLIIIALFVRDSFVRPFVGDILVVIFLYTLFRSIFCIKRPKRLALFVVVFAFIIEFAQYLDVLERFGLENASALTIILGATFDWVDLMAYALGACACLLLDSQAFPFNLVTKK